MQFLSFVRVYAWDMVDAMPLVAARLYLAYRAEARISLSPSDGFRDGDYEVLGWHNAHLDQAMSATVSLRATSERLPR